MNTDRSAPTQGRPTTRSQRDVQRRATETAEECEARLARRSKKARVEEEERQAVKERYEKRRREDIQFEEFLDFKRKRYN